MGRLKTFNRNDVLDSAIQLFWKKGYADTSMSDLEKATGVNKSGLYSEFKDKDDLFLESLRKYHDQNPLYEVLKKEPLGWKNIEDYFETKLHCKGQKGCFMAYTMREYSIIPYKVKSLLEKSSSDVFRLFLQNVKAENVKDPETITTLILTYATGLSLKASLHRPEELYQEIKSFLQILQNNFTS